MSPLVRLGRTLEGTVPPAAVAVLTYHQAQAEAEYRRVRRQLQALRFAWTSLSPEARRQHDPHRYLAEVLDEACPAYGYLRLPVALGLWGEEG